MWLAVENPVDGDGEFVESPGEIPGVAQKDHDAILRRDPHHEAPETGKASGRSENLSRAAVRPGLFAGLPPIGCDHVTHGEDSLLRGRLYQRISVQRPVEGVEVAKRRVQPPGRRHTNVWRIHIPIEGLRIPRRTLPHDWA